MYKLCINFNFNWINKIEFEKYTHGLDIGLPRNPTVNWRLQDDNRKPFVARAWSARVESLYLDRIASQ